MSSVCRNPRNGLVFVDTIHSSWVIKDSDAIPRRATCWVRLFRVSCSLTTVKGKGPHCLVTLFGGCLMCDACFQGIMPSAGVLFVKAVPAVGFFLSVSYF